MKTTGSILIFLLALATQVNAQNPAASRYVNHTEVGAMFGRVKYPNPNNGNQEQVDNHTNLTAQTFNGIRLNRRATAGVTIGMDWYKSALINPVAAGIRYDLTQKSNVKLFGTLDAGYGFTWFHEDSQGYNSKGGVMLNPGIGLRIGKEAGFTLAFTYKRQEVHVDKPPLWDQVKRSEDRVYNRLALRMGISF